MNSESVCCFDDGHARGMQDGSLSEKTVRWLSGAVLVAVALLSSAVLAVQLTDTTPSAPVIPHELNPGQWPQPDYFSEALQRTEVHVPERQAALKLMGNTSYQRGGLLVLPVQGQAFSFSNRFRAALGAYLDRVLFEHGIDANAQVDLYDVHGPYVRRTAPQVLGEFAERSGYRNTLAMYVGYDGIDQGFITLVLSEAGKARTWHQQVKLPAEEHLALGAMASAVATLFEQSDVHRLSARKARPAEETQCSEQTWQLRPLSPVASATARACQALLVSALLPAYSGPTQIVGPHSASKVAWLARAWAFSDLAGMPVPVRAAVRDLALTQLDVNGAQVLPTQHFTAADPVVAKLAQLVGLPLRFKNAPVQSSDAAVDDAFVKLAATLPGTVSAFARQRLLFGRPFSTVDFCALVHAAGTPATDSGCSDSSTAFRVAGSVPTAIMQQMIAEWRVASHYKRIDRAAFARGSAKDFAEAVAGVPSELATHPLIESLLFDADPHFSQGGAFEAELNRVRANLARGARTMTTLQIAQLIAENKVLANPNIASDEPVARLLDDMRRLHHVLEFDQLALSMTGIPRRGVGDPAVFLAPAPVAWRLMAPTPSQLRLLPAPVTTVVVSGEQSQEAVFSGPWNDAEESAATLKRALERDPKDMALRSRLAKALLKEGAGVSASLEVIEAHTKLTRPTDQLEESHVWSLPAHLYFFAGEQALARRYYEVAQKAGTRTVSDMMARVRLRLLAQDWGGALRMAQDRLQRYESDYARRDVGGLSLLEGRPAEAWAVAQPRAARSDTLQLWMAVFAAQRQSGLSVKQVNEWVFSEKMDQVVMPGGRDLHELLALMHTVVDRVPTHKDIDELRSLRRKYPTSGQYWAASADLVRAAIAGGKEPQTVRTAHDVIRDFGRYQNNHLLPLYVWVAAHSGLGDYHAVTSTRETSLYGDFDHLLAKAMLLGSEGNVDASVKYLEAARFELGSIGLGTMDDRPIPAPYQFGLSAYLLFKKTKSPAIQTVGLKFARAYQAVFPFMAWTHGLEVALDPKAAVSSKAACRAYFLDKDSYFLSEARLEVRQLQSCPKTFK